MQAPFVPVSYDCFRGKLMKNLLKGRQIGLFVPHLLTKYYKQIIRVGAVGGWFTAITLYTWNITDCNEFTISNTGKFWNSKLSSFTCMLHPKNLVKVYQILVNWRQLFQLFVQFYFVIKYMLHIIFELVSLYRSRASVSANFGCSPHTQSVTKAWFRASVPKYICGLGLLLFPGFALTGFTSAFPPQKTKFSVSNSIKELKGLRSFNQWTPLF